MESESSGSQSHKSAYDLVKSKIGVISRVMSLPESVSEESEWFHFFRFHFQLRCLVKTSLSESETEVEEPINHKNRN